MAGCDPKKDLNLLYSEKSPGGTIELQVYFADTMGFGAHNIKIFAKTGYSSEKIILDEKLFNDGAKLRKSNVAIKWGKQAITVSLTGQEQAIKTYHIDLSAL